MAKSSGKTTGGLGGNGDEAPEIQGSRDLIQLARVMDHPQYEMPTGFFRTLPKKMQYILDKKSKDGKGNYGEFEYSPRARQIAARLLMKMAEDNVKTDPPEQKVAVRNIDETRLLIDAVVVKIEGHDDYRESRRAEIAGRLKPSNGKSKGP